MYSYLSAAVLAAVLSSGAAQAVDLDAYLRQEAFKDIKISPNGEYLATTLPGDDFTAVAILRTSDHSVVGSMRPPRDNHATSFHWVNDNRLLIGLAEKFGSLDAPRPTGELMGMNADGGRASLLVGYRVSDRGAGTRIQPKKAEAVAGFLTDDLPGEERSVVIAVWPFSDEPFTRAERMDVLSGQRTILARSPVRRASFTTDASGNVRFAHGADTDNVNKLYYRAATGGEWQLVNNEVLSGRIERAVGFSEDGALAYLQSEQPKGPDAIVSWNPQTGERRTLLRDEVVDPSSILYRPGTSIPVGALYMGDVPRTRFFDEASADARLYRGLETAFKGQGVYITSSTRDGSKVLVKVWSGSNPGDFYLYDIKKRNAQYLVSRSDWIDVARAATVTPFQMKARDGLALHGFLTRPAGTEGRALPMVVVPHGGPLGVFDDGSYDREAQLLAAAGYAVLQVNFRGSGNYGRAHGQAAAEQWGRAMQDDVTDATRWAITQGMADKDRICIYGASYGAYSAMMGAAREPGLYQCAAGYVGVYDLPMMFNRGDIQDSASGMTYLREWLGDPKKLDEVSAVTQAGRIKVPVFLAAGGEDKRAPVQHTERMEAALKRSGTPVESLYFKTEGHGFYTLEHRREYYGKLLTFLSRSLGGATASAAPAATPAAGERKAP
ncbi:TPA: S9 family peptidase [Stenotrophomonas maltophilia]|nr:S9 family peptidase [Stenotrophomonas maltophilia]HDS1026521.1 S9 family peptidase [Stenotrophomonas maltophilia]HDS1030572.1 S9 family peptidase [Stenotrophomonas maltophilia]HDS1035284.1 S9 family peptidase [Stenotrophomonas maltophilia]